MTFFASYESSKCQLTFLSENLLILLRLWSESPSHLITLRPYFCGKKLEAVNIEAHQIEAKNVSRPDRITVFLNMKILSTPLVEQINSSEKKIE